MFEGGWKVKSPKVCGRDIVGIEPVACATESDAAVCT